MVLPGVCEGWLHIQIARNIFLRGMLVTQCVEVTPNLGAQRDLSNCSILVDPVDDIFE